jgi:uncharacterized protein (DUF1800 family)
MPLPQLAGTLGLKNAAHLLRRATFGPTKAQIDNFAGRTVADAINTLFNNNIAQVLPNEPLDPNGNPFINTPPNPTIMDGELQEAFKGWWIGKMLAEGLSPNQPTALHKIIFFFHTHFTTIQEKVSNARFLYFQYALFREFAFDQGKTNPLRTFKELAKKICIDNAMLVVLDGFLNVRGSVNENFAREYYELYTIGKGLNNVYPPTNDRNDYFFFTEDDVRASARVLSGFTVDETFQTLDNVGPSRTNLPRGKANISQHDNDPKQFSPRFNNEVITPTTPPDAPTEASMLQELDILVDKIFAKSETHKNICRRIYRYFVYYNITEEIDNTIINEMVNTFVASGYRIEPVIRELLGSVHFYEAGAGVVDDKMGGIIKSPLELIIGTIRFFEFQLPDYQTQTEQFYKLTGGILGFMREQGLNFLNPFDIAGYEAYFQPPLFNRYWISTNSLTRRYQFMSRLTDPAVLMDLFGMDMVTANRKYLDFFKAKYPQNATVVTFDFLIKELSKYLFPLPTEVTEITTDRYGFFHTQFEKGVADSFGSPNPLASWNFNWNNLPEPDTLNNAITFIVNTMLQSPEYQLF